MSNPPRTPNQPPTPPGDHEPASQDTLFELMDTVQIAVTEHCAPFEENGFETYNGAFLTKGGEVLGMWWSRDKSANQLADGVSLDELLLNVIFNTGQSAVVSKREFVNLRELIETTVVLDVFNDRVDTFKTISVVNPVDEQAFLQRMAEMPDDIRESLIKSVLQEGRTPEELAEREEQYAIAEATDSHVVTEAEAKTLMREIETAQYLPPTPPSR